MMYTHTWIAIALDWHLCILSCMYIAVVMSEGDPLVAPPEAADTEPDNSQPPTEKPSSAPQAPPTTQPSESAPVQPDGGGGGNGSKAAPTPSMPPTPQEKKAREFFDQAEKKYRSSQTFFGGLFG